MPLPIQFSSVPSPVALLQPGRSTVWNPGMTSVGGIPARNTIYATIAAASYGNGTVDAAAGIQAVLNACPAGQVVLLGPGNFLVNDILLISTAITLRGSGATQTILTKGNGVRGRTTTPVPGSTGIFEPTDPGSYGYDAKPIIIVGPSRYPGPDNSTSTGLTADGVADAFSVTVASTAGFSVGQIALLDELSGATWQATPPNFPGNALVWRSDRIAWNMHLPVQAFQDDCAHSDINGPYDVTPGDHPGSMSWFCRTDRPTCEVKEIASISGNTITFTSPLHISYRTANTAQLTRYTVSGSQSGANSVHVKNAGVESLTVQGGADGQIRFECAAYCWAKDVENTQWLGEGFTINGSFRIEIRGCWAHKGAWPQPGGGGYAISFATGGAEALIEDNIIHDTCKCMVARCSGAGSVIAYNYTDDAWDQYDPTWQEVHLNASHMAGPHHVLFEGNHGPNFDSDYTHGNAIYMTVFRNRLTGVRANFSGLGNARAVGAAYGSWWFSIIGNVLGVSGGMAGWVYDASAMSSGTDWSQKAVWKIGYDPERFGMSADPDTINTLVRGGNYDYVTNSVHWETLTARSMPNSLYLSGKPSFFGSLTWPWVDATGSTQVYTLPAKLRLDNGTPFAPPP